MMPSLKKSSIEGKRDVEELVEGLLNEYADE
jgi:hypothetical protein